MERWLAIGLLVGDSGSVGKVGGPENQKGIADDCFARTGMLGKGRIMNSWSWMWLCFASGLLGFSTRTGWQDGESEWVGFLEAKIPAVMAGAEYHGY